MTELLNNFHLALPEIIILVTACVALLCDLFLSHKVRCIAFYVACAGLISAAGTCVLFLGFERHLLFNGLLVSDDMTCLLNLFIVLVVCLSFIYARHYLIEREMPQADFYVLGLFSTAGMMILISAHTLLMVYLGLELLSLPLYAMTAIRRTQGDGSEAAMKYFVMGAIASGMLLYGISLLFGATGQLGFTDIATAIHSDAVTEHGLLAFSLVFIVAGIGFKLATVPFHMWAPDVYEGAPAPVALFISSAPKIAVIGMMVRLLSTGLMDLTHEWQSLILIMALLSTGFGNLLAIAQTNIKRLFAYSAISHMGYALFGILVATPEGYSASLYYVVVYALMAAAGFGLVVILSRNGIEIEQIDDLKGLNRRNPWLAFLMMIVLFSMAGVPPTVGFFTKLFVLKALVDAQLMWVAVLGLIFAVIGAFYYIRVIKVMYFDAPLADTPIKLSKGINLIFSLNGLSLLYFGIFPGALISACINALA
jgi:NADH-quinone oxidoreductase subunit N